jgi:hypothetical protein
VGDAIVHTAEATGGLTVVSVAAPADVEAGSVLAVAHQLAPALATGEQPATRSLFDLPLGEAPLWTIDEVETTTTSPTGRVEACSAVLPAWSAEDRHDLTVPTLGFGAAARVLQALIGPQELLFDAAQVVRAKYHREGFEAAAITGLSLARTAIPSKRQGLLRRAELRFAHPYAVVAVTTDPVDGADSPWHGVPVFSAWVADPEEP